VPARPGAGRLAARRVARRRHPGNLSRAEGLCAHSPGPPVVHQSHFIGLVLAALNFLPLFAKMVYFQTVDFIYILSVLNHFDDSVVNYFCNKK